MANVQGLKFTIPGTPKAQERSKATKIGGFIHEYDPATSKNQKAFIKLLALNAMKKQGWLKTNLPIKMYIKAFKPILKSMSKKDKEKAKQGFLRPTTKPDIDNIQKLIQDALNDICYDDDKQIISCLTEKYYDDGDGARTDVYLEIRREDG